MRRKPILLLLMFLPTLCGGPVAASTGAAVTDATRTRLLRFPDIHGDRVAFAYAGDIWTADAEGGLARRLTSDAGQEVFPKFSPDGKWIAFTGEYGGNRQVFVIAADGGQPRQLTFYNDVGPLPPRGGFDNRVIGWTPDGRRVIFKANRLPWGKRVGRYYSVPVDGGLETALPIPQAGGGDISADGRTIVYTPKEREFRTWKRHVGGGAQDIWTFDLETGRAEQLTEFRGTDNEPVWVGDTIYFTSDRDGMLNLYARDPRSGEIRQVTHHDEFDVLFPSAGPGAIVYESGGDLYRFDPATERSVRIPIRAAGDFPETLPHIRNVADFIESGDLSPTGARALFTARGDLFTVPATEGEIRNLTRSPGVREMDGRWSPDGKWIAYLGDRTGEYEIYIRAQDGSGPERQVTTGGDIWRYPPAWSPDSTRLAFADKNRRLRYVEVDSGRIVDVDRGRQDDITEYSWSPDSRWIAYTLTAPNRLTSIHVYSIEQGRTFPLTGDSANDYQPVFDPDGRYIYFLSDRDFHLTFSGFEFNYLYTGPTRIYAGPLNPDIPMPFVPRSDEEPAGGGGEEEAEPAAGDRGAPAIRIEPEGFSSRVMAIPGPPGNYRSLAASAAGPYYLIGDGPAAALKRFRMEDKEEDTILQGIDEFVLSGSGEKVLYRAGDDVGLVDAAPGQKPTDGLLDLDGMDMRIDPPAEWHEIYVDAWRLLRDWFYDPGMHGLDWTAIRARYEPLVDSVASRIDLDFVLGEMGAELSAGHVYVQPGDQPAVERIEGGLLGAELEADDSGRYRIARIFPGENWHPAFRSPLTEPGVAVREGDFLLAIDGLEITTADNPYRFLENGADRIVTLLVNDKPRLQGAHEETVRPIASETNLRYLDWVRGRRRIVDAASGGRIGYIHVPDTAVEGNRELFKTFYPQAGKEALILDVRFNAGGFVPDRMIELIDRPLLNYWVRRGPAVDPEPGFSNQGPKVCLINGLSGSGGDAFPYYFRKRDLGPIIGTRTWGGLIGISDQPDLIDGGTVTVPQFRFLDTDGHWAVENEGVAPDIEVVDRPDLVADGQDPTLEKAIEVLMEELRLNPPHPPEVPPVPTQRP